MTTLTKDLIIQRTQKSDLNLIKNLNLWGNNLTNVDVLKDLPNLEVLSLSVNSLTTLEPFRHLTCLQELYLRRNNISDLKQLAYLTNLKRLKILASYFSMISYGSHFRINTFFFRESYQSIIRIIIKCRTATLEMILTK
ncbi:hypothetical protein BKA69DRAFT_1097971 [Paraphysoderma sedebokerense]|nr:hypothetical protein BKA69DRAFT_1097971 [Paraphysoderma sedebokerense]